MKLLEQGAQKLRKFVDRSHGVDLAALLPVVDAWQQEARTLLAAGRADYDPARLPQLRYARVVH